MKTYQVIFQPSGRRGEISEGKTIIEASREFGVEIESVCGEARVCGKCRVKVEEGFFEGFGMTSRSGTICRLQLKRRESLSAR